MEGVMDPIPCPSCDSFFVPRNKLQIFCSGSDCQRTRKALWQKQKLACDPAYKKDQKLSNQKWLQNTPDYWTDYRQKNPKKADRNRSLQKVRNYKSQKNKAHPKASKAIGIAKMDSRKPSNDISSPGLIQRSPLINLILIITNPDRPKKVQF